MSKTRRPARGRWFLAASKRFREEGRAADAPCWICGQPIDYDLPAGHPFSHTLDHIKDVARYPELHDDPANWAHAHHGCNSRRANEDAGNVRINVLPDWWI